MGYEVGLGREQLEPLAPQCRLAIADSAFNEGELDRGRLRPHGRGSLLIDMTVHAEPDPDRLRRPAGGQGRRGP